MKNNVAVPSSASHGALHSVPRRIVLFLGAGIALISGLLAALDLLGFLAVGASFAQYHGMLMVFGFVGGAISLERAVAVRNSWSWGAPAASMVAVILLLVGAPRVLVVVLWLVAYLVLIATYAVIYQRQQTLAVIVQSLGAVAAVFAILRWSYDPQFPVMLAATFPIATIIGERMELARLSFAPQTAACICGEVFFLALAALIDVPRLFGIALVVLAVHVLLYDVARRFIRRPGLPRYSAICMLLGYWWLVVAGVVWIVAGLGTSYSYDVQVHCIFLGFVMSMIFAHAPTILSAVLLRQIPFSWMLYIPVALLHGGLAIRICGTLNVSAWQHGGLLNVIAVLCFMIMAIFLGVTRGRLTRG